LAEGAGGCWEKTIVTERRKARRLRDKKNGNREGGRGVKKKPDERGILGTVRIQKPRQSSPIPAKEGAKRKNKW